MVKNKFGKDNPFILQDLDTYILCIDNCNNNKIVYDSHTWVTPSEIFTLLMLF